MSLQTVSEDQTAGATVDKKLSQLSSVATEASLKSITQLLCAFVIRSKKLRLSLRVISLQHTDVLLQGVFSVFHVILTSLQVQHEAVQIVQLFLQFSTSATMRVCMYDVDVKDTKASTQECLLFLEVFLSQIHSQRAFGLTLSLGLTLGFGLCFGTSCKK